MSLKVVDIASRPVDKVVEAIEKLLADAKSGKVRNICYAAEYGSFIRTDHTGSSDAFALLGRIDRMKHVIHTQMDAEETSE